MNKKLILGSTSIYRKELLTRLGIAFDVAPPSCDEDTLKQSLLLAKKSPLQIAEALATAKAKSIFDKYPDAVVIGSDQLVDHNGQIIGKSKTAEKAQEQLGAFSGQSHLLITSVVIMSDKSQRALNHISKMQMKTLTPQEIKNYLHKDKPFDCAGSYKIEQSGIALFEKIETDDFSAIQGLPLMWLSQQLKEIGYELFTT